MCYRKCRGLGPRVWYDGSALIGSDEDFQGFRNRIWFSCSEMGHGVGECDCWSRCESLTERKGTTPTQSITFPYTFYPSHSTVQNYLSKYLLSDLIDSITPLYTNHDLPQHLTPTLAYTVFTLPILPTFLIDRMMQIIRISGMVRVK